MKAQGGVAARKPDNGEPHKHVAVVWNGVAGPEAASPICSQRNFM